MSGLFNRLPQFPPSPSGIEREVLRAMPKLTLGGSAAFLLPAVLMRLWYGWSWPLSGEQALISTDIFLISLLILYWTVLFTVALGAFIVLVMKGPGYVADPYPLQDAERPNPHLKSVWPR
ncbi:hypothetical protein [Aquaspirillum soli]|jgi:hypothetical protein